MTNFIVYTILNFMMIGLLQVDNIIQYNLAVFTKSHSSMLNVDQTPASFWIVNPNNIGKFAN